MATGMLLDGIFASEAIDSSGEILDVAGCDISTLDTEGIANWEHRGDDSPGHSPSDIVGKIVFAKKIFGPKDCDNERQLNYWKQLELPFIYGIVRLYDGAGHSAAKDLAAQIRDHAANGDPILVRYSIEGSTLKTDPNNKKHLLRSVARRCALTVKPCNRSCQNQIVSDPNAPEGFDKNPGGEKKDFLDEVLKRAEHPMYRRLGGSVETQGNPIMQEPDVGVAMQQMTKTLTAGSYDAAPSALTGGSALQVEDQSRLFRGWAHRAKAAYRDWDHSHDFRKFLKSRLPEASLEFIDRFADMVETHHLRRREVLTKAETGVEALVRKLERWSIDLRKAAQELAAPEPEPEPTEVEFQGKKVRPGHAQTLHGDSQDLSIVGHSPEHYFAVPRGKTSWSPDEVVKLPRRHEGTHFQVLDQPEVLDSEKVDALQHGDPIYNASPEQSQLIHGLDFAGRSEPGTSGVNANASSWRVGGHGGPVYVKRRNVSSDISDARREVVYHNVARDVFGMGHYVPAAALLMHPRTGEEHAVIDRVKGEHVGTDDQGGVVVPKDPQHREALKKLGDSGELDKLALMNMVLGNHDRHGLNWMLDQKGGMKLIDHGFSLDDGPQQHMPHYWALYHGIKAHESGDRNHAAWQYEPLHDAAKSWAQKLDPHFLEEALRDHGVPEDRIYAAGQRLRALQNAIAENPDINKIEAHRSPFFPQGTRLRGDAEHTRRTA